MQPNSKARLAVDIGGTFTDVAIALPGSSSSYITAKCLTTPDDPVTGAMTGVASALERAADFTSTGRRARAVFAGQ